MTKTATARLYWNEVIEYGVCFNQYKTICEEILSEGELTWIHRMKNFNNKEKELMKISEFCVVEENKIED